MRCEITETILQKCVKKYEIELGNNSSPTQKVEAIKAKEEKKINVKPEINLFKSIHEAVEEVQNNYEYILKRKKSSENKKMNL